MFRAEERSIDIGQLNSKPPKDDKADWEKFLAPPYMPAGVSIEYLGCYLWHRIISSFPRILNWKIIKTSPEGPKARTNKIGINFMILF